MGIKCMCGSIKIFPGVQLPGSSIRPGWVLQSFTILKPIIWRKIADPDPVPPLNPRMKCVFPMRSGQVESNQGILYRFFASWVHLRRKVTQTYEYSKNVGILGFVQKARMCYFSIKSDVVCIY